MAIYHLGIEPPHSPLGNKTGVTPMNARYAMTLGDVTDLVDEITDSDAGSFVNTVTKLFTDPMANIISLKMFPFDIAKAYQEWEALQPSAVKISNVTLRNTTALYLDHGASEWYDNKALPILLAGRFHFERHFNDYRDASPFTKIEIWCPFVGFVPIDMAIAYEGTFSVQYAVDLYTGDFAMSLVHHNYPYSEDTPPGTGYVILTREGNMASTIQLAGTSTSAYAERRFGVATSLVEGVISGITNPIAGVSRAVSGVASQVSPLSVSKGALSVSNLGNFMPGSPYAVITRGSGWVNPAGNTDVIGRPTDAVIPFRQGMGYVEVDAVHVDHIPSGTSAEIDEIEQLLKSGVFL